MTEGRERVTYATLAAGQTEDFRRKYDEALERLAGVFRRAPRPRHRRPAGIRAPRSSRTGIPIDTRCVLGRLPGGTPADVDGRWTRRAGAFPTGAAAPGRSASPCCAAPPTSSRSTGSTSRPW